VGSPAVADTSPHHVQGEALLLARFGEMTARLIRCSAEQELFREVPGAARDMFEADTAWLALVEGDEVVLRTQSGLRRSDMAQRWRMKIGEGVAGRVAQDGEPVGGHQGHR
jgi:hypothetical protein